MSGWPLLNNYTHTHTHTHTQTIKKKTSKNHKHQDNIGLSTAKLKDSLGIWLKPYVIFRE